MATNLAAPPSREYPSETTERYYRDTFRNRAGSVPAPGPADSRGLRGRLIPARYEPIGLLACETDVVRKHGQNTNHLAKLDMPVVPTRVRRCASGLCAGIPASLGSGQVLMTSSGVSQPRCAWPMAVLQVGQVGGGVRVAVDGELHPGVLRGPDVIRGQVGAGPGGSSPPAPSRSARRPGTARRSRRPPAAGGRFLRAVGGR